MPAEITPETMMEPEKDPGFFGRIWKWILRKLHLYTEEEHNKVCCVVEILYETQIAGLKAAHEQLLEMNQEMSDSIEELQHKLLVYKKTAKENLDYVKDVQKAIGDIMHTSKNFGFPNSVPIPGSAAVVTDHTEKDGEEFSVVRSRVITLDGLTTMINDNPDAETRTGLVVNHMRQYGLMNRIAESLISAGAVNFVLAYNRNCTCYEMYTEITAKNYANGGAMVRLEDPYFRDKLDDRELSKTDVK